MRTNVEQKPLRVFARWPRLAAVTACFLLLGVPAHPSPVLADVSPAEAAASSLFIGYEDLPCEMVLWKANIGVASDSHWLSQIWLGPPTSASEARPAPNSSLRIRVDIRSSAEEALEAARYELADMATPPGEVTGTQPFASFTDRAWFRGGTLLFTRGGATVSMHFSQKDAFDPGIPLRLGELLSRKVDAALAGRPEPPAQLPPSAEEMGVTVEDAWLIWEAAKQSARQGGGQTTVALQSGKSFARAFPARRIAKKDYMVPLRYLAAVAVGKEKVRIAKGHATMKVAGKPLVFKNGQSQAYLANRSIQLSHKVESVKGQMFVPLSVVSALGKRLKWEQRGSVQIAMILPATR